MLVKWLNFPHMKLFQKSKACQSIPWHNDQSYCIYLLMCLSVKIQHSFILYLRMPNSESISREMLLWHAVVKLKQVGRKSILASNENVISGGRLLLENSSKTSFHHNARRHRWRRRNGCFSISTRRMSFLHHYLQETNTPVWQRVFAQGNGFLTHLCLRLPCKFPLY